MAITFSPYIASAEQGAAAPSAGPRCRERRIHRGEIWILQAFFGPVFFFAVAAGSAAETETPAVVLGRWGADDWSARSGAAIQRDFIPGTPLLPRPPAGLGLKITTTTDAALETMPSRRRLDWRRIGAISFWTSVDSTDSKPLALEVELLGADGAPAAVCSRTIEAGWRKHQMPLCWFRPKRVWNVDWTAISGLRLRFPAPGVFWLTEVQAEAGSPEPAPGQVAEVIFPRRADVRIFAATDVVLLTDAAELDAALLLKHFKGVAAAVRSELNFLNDKPSPPFFAVFQNEKDFRRFPARLAKQFGASAATPSGAGFTLGATAGSTWSSNRGSLRPVFTHEYVHALLARSAGLPTQGDWLDEGLATHFQLRFHPQPGLAAAIRAGLDDAPPLDEFCDGRPVAVADYWQALTIADYLLSEQQRRLPALVAAFHRAKSTNLGPQLRPILKTDWPQFRAAWRKSCLARSP